MKLRELKELSLDELRAREHELIDEVFHLRMKRASAQLPNPDEDARHATRAGAREDAAARADGGDAMQGGGR